MFGRPSIVSSMLPLLGAAFLLFVYMAKAQLAITEMMSAHAGPADYFELTNFGTNTINLEDYRFTDADHRKERERPLLVLPGEATFLQPGESILFIRTNLTEAEFRVFWGPCLASNVQVRSYSKPGFSSFGDSLLIYDSHKKLVDEVEFGSAPNVVSFTYDSGTGQFGVPSSLDTNACFSASGHNIGSPGSTKGPVPLQIVRQPGDLIVCRGRDARFTVEAVGLPHPRYQWYFNGSSIPDADKATLVIPEATERSEGSYFVRVFTSLSNIVSGAATLKLDVAPAPPTIEVRPVDTLATIYRGAHFSVEICGYPPPHFQWFSNGIPLLDETNRVLSILSVTPEMSGSEYRVRVENQLGSVEGWANLYVTNSSPIRITEIQANPIAGCDGHNDWFEVTNFGSTDVDMQGYRFLDDLDLENAFVVDRPVILHAHESIIFVKNSSVGTFFDWWGADQLPRNLQVIPYTGFSLSSGGDVLYLWSDSAQDVNELVDYVSLATNSVGFTIDYETGELGGKQNTSGTPGVFRAVECGDIGTPGFTSDSPPQFSAIENVSEEIRLTWRAIPRFKYTLEYCERFNGQWFLLKEVEATNHLCSATDRSPPTGVTRFYRLNRFFSQ